MKRELTSIAKKAGGRYNERSGTIKGLERVQSQYVLKRFESAGFDLFHSYNSQHPGVNLERQESNDTVWYHVTVEPGKQGSGATATKQWVLFVLVTSVDQAGKILGIFTPTPSFI